MQDVQKSKDVRGDSSRPCVRQKSREEACVGKEEKEIAAGPFKIEKGGKSPCW
jgi:hypothetical protein